jgi:hypothetical protein
MSDDNRAELARLIGQELEESRRGPAEIVKGWTQGAQRSFYGWKDGDTIPLRRSRSMLEDALGWRRGVVTDILEAPITKTFTLSEIRDWSALPEPGLAKARELSTDELLIELTRRVGKMATELESLKALKDGSPITSSQNMFDVAAHSTDAGMNSEHLED